MAEEAMMGEVEQDVMAIIAKKIRVEKPVLSRDDRLEDRLLALSRPRSDERADEDAVLCYGMLQ